MRVRPTTPLATAFLLVACNGSSTPHVNPTSPDAAVAHPDAAKTPDAAAPLPDAAAPVPDAPVSATCNATVLGAQDIADPGTATFMAWGGPVTTNLGDGGPSTFRIEFYGGIEPNLATAIDLSTGNQNNYATCAECVRIITTDAMGMPVRQFFQSGGTMTLTMDPITNKHMIGSVTNLALDEVTIDSTTFMSTPVVGGKCLSFGTLALDHTAVPNAWTCPAASYGDGANCNCMCGIPDPDCNIATAPVVGCTATQACVNAACVDRPANDTCQTAQALTIGTAVTGTTVGAVSNYDSGLEAATCTGFPQIGGDVAYSVHLAAATGYTFTLSNVDATFDASISLVGPGAPAVCDAMPVACLAGSDSGLAGAGETFSFTTTAAGTYYVIVDSYFTTNPGAFTVEVTSP